MGTMAMTDTEFSVLMGEAPLAFAARLRAETMAHNLKERIAAVAADLRRHIAMGDVTDARPVAHIASEFDRLANRLETDATDPTTWRNFDAANEPAPAPWHTECKVVGWK